MCQLCETRGRSYVRALLQSPPGPLDRAIARARAIPRRLRRDPFTLDLFTVEYQVEGRRTRGRPVLRVVR